MDFGAYSECPPFAPTALTAYTEAVAELHNFVKNPGFFRCHRILVFLIFKCPINVHRKGQDSSDSWFLFNFLQCSACTRGQHRAAVWILLPHRCDLGTVEPVLYIWSFFIQPVFGAAVNSREDRLEYFQQQISLLEWYTAAITLLLLVLLLLQHCYCQTCYSNVSLQ